MAEAVAQGGKTIRVPLPKGTPKELGRGTFGAVFLRKGDKTGELALKVYRRRGDRDVEHTMMALLAGQKNRSTRIIAFHGDADVEVPPTHAPTLQQSRPDQSTPPCPGLLFEFCPFGNVEAFISTWHPVIDQTILGHWTSQVAEGLQFLASLNIVHADLKPKNILVRADKTLVVADLGRSFLAKTPQSTHGIRGTLSYASPEILRETGITPIADVFSLGLIVYEWATGELPHTRAWEHWRLSTMELVEELKWRVGTNDWKPALPATFTADFSMLVQGMLKPLHSQRLTASQVLASPPIIETKNLAFDVQLGLTGDEAIVARQAMAERTAQLGQIAQFARDKLTAEQEAKRCAERMAGNADQLAKARTEAKLTRDELAETKKAAEQAVASSQQALEEARVAKATLAQVQAAFAEAIQNAKSNTVVRLTEQQAEGLEDHGVETFLRLNTARGEVARLLAENARLRDERDVAKQQLDNGVIAKLLKDVAQLQHERSGSKRSHREGPLGSEKRSRVDAEVDDLQMHLSQASVEDAPVPSASSISQVEHLPISLIFNLYSCSLKTIKIKIANFDLMSRRRGATRKLADGRNPGPTSVPLQTRALQSPA